MRHDRMVEWVETILKLRKWLSRMSLVRRNGEIRGKSGTVTIFLSDVKARQDKMVELVTRMMELKKQQARAPKKQSPSAKQLLDQKLAITDQQIDALVYELYDLTDSEIRIIEEVT